MEPTNAPNEAVNEHAPVSAADQSTEQTGEQTSAAPADTDETLSLSELITRAESRQSEIALELTELQAQIEALAEEAARDGADMQILQDITRSEDAIKDLVAERVSIEESLVPLRAAVAKVRAEQEEAAADEQRAQLAGTLGDTLTRALELSQQLESAVASVASIAKERRALKKQWREAVAATVGNMDQRIMINREAEALFLETPTLDQFLTVDAQLLAGSGAQAGDRAQRIRDRLAEVLAD